MNYSNFDEIKNSKSFSELNQLLEKDKISSFSSFNDSIWILDTKPDVVPLYFNLTKRKKLEDKKLLLLLWKTILYIVFSGKTKKKSRNKGKKRIYDLLLQFIEFLYEIDFFSKRFVFTPELADQYIHKLQHKDIENEHKRNLLSSLLLWFQLNPYLPDFFQVNINPLRGRKLIEIFPNNLNDDEKGWKPISMNLALYLLRESISYMENYADDILNVYFEWNQYYGLYPEKERFEAFGRFYYNKGRSEKVAAKLAEIVLCKIKKPSKEHPLFEIWNYGNKIFNNEIYISKAIRLIKRKQALNALKHLKASCLIVLLFSTGMRKSELYSLERGCVRKVFDEGIPFIKNDIYKVDIDNNEIPISQKAFDAVNILERIAYIKTKEDKGSLLIPLGISKKDLSLNKKPHTGDFVERLIGSFCYYIGWETVKTPHIHQFRHTLASAVWERTEQAPVLLMILYNHSSLSMTLKYLRKNPYIKKAQRDLFQLKYKGLVNQIVQYAQKKEISGPGASKVEKLMNYVRTEESFKGKTEIELTIELEELFMTLIEQDQMRLFLTPVCVCIRYNTNVTKSPCMQIEDHGNDTYFSKLPRTDRCVGTLCQDSLFTPLQTDSIHQSMNFYEEYLNKVPSNKKENILLANIANSELKKYNKVVKQIEN